MNAQAYSPAPQRPVPRRRVLISLALLAIAVAGIVTLTEVLRHPLPSGGEAAPAELGGDPRNEFACSTPPAREGQERPDVLTITDEVDRVTSNQLYDCPETYNGQTVRYRGEVVGAVLQRDQGAWLFLNDDVYSDDLGPLPTHRDFRGGNAGAGVYVPPDIVDQITFVGGPRAKGDIVEVVGTFHRVDPATREVAVIRASSARISQPGGAMVMPVLHDRRVVAAILGALAVVALVAERIVARRR